MKINMRVAIYVRVSTDEQADRGTIESQIEFGNKYCDLHAISEFEFYRDDGITGTLPLEERPEGARLFNDAKEKKFDTLLIYKLDRLGRSARVILNAVYELEQYGIKVKSMTEPFDTGDPAGRFLLTMLAGVADLERSTILERLWHGANRAARDGKWIGGIVPYGYFVNDQRFLEISTEKMPGLDLSEADVVKLIFDLYTKNRLTHVKICDYLNALKIPPSYALAGRKVTKGKRKENTAGIWIPHQIGRMIKNSTYKGIHIYGKRSSKQRELIPREVPAIVSVEQWDLAQVLLKENKLEFFKEKTRNYLLRGLILCEECGHHYTGAPYTQYKTKEKKTFYRCIGKQVYKNKEKERCKVKNIPGTWLENMVWEDCLNFINNPGDVLQSINQKIEETKVETRNYEEELKLITSSIQQVDAERQSILDLYRKKLISSADIETQFSKINMESELLLKKKNEIESLLAANDSSVARANSAEDYLAYLRNKIKDGNPSFQQKREIVKAIVEKIKVRNIDINGKTEIDIKILYRFSPHQTTLSPNTCNTRLQLRLFPQ
ncbi:MAG: recombinase family protein [Sporomusaceae bacterium]|nr:recombinase family protein [Sporomusaceae bacterium]